MVFNRVPPRATIAQKEIFGPVLAVIGARTFEDALAILKSREAVMEAENLSGVVNELSAAGYTDTFRAEAQGLRAVTAGCVHAPESLAVDKVVRFEGITNPDDEAIVFALHCRAHGAKGTYVTAYGPQMSPIDAEMARRLGG